METLNELFTYDPETLPEELKGRHYDALVEVDVDPYLVYKVLKKIFGKPNGRGDEYKVQWTYALRISDFYVEIYNWKMASCSIAIYDVNADRKKSERIGKEIGNLITNEARKFKNELNLKLKTPSGRIIQNPYILYFSTAENLRQTILDMISNRDKMLSIDVSVSFELFKHHFDFSRSAFLMYLSSFEGFLNLIYELHLKEDYRDKRISETINRLQIDVKLRLLPTYCNGFTRTTIDSTDPRFKNYLRIVDLRNDFVHANLMQEEHVIQEDGYDFIARKSIDQQFIPKDFRRISLEHVDMTRTCILDAIELVLEAMKRTQAKEFKKIMTYETIHIEH